MVNKTGRERRFEKRQKLLARIETKLAVKAAKAKLQRRSSY
jgi:hypothetical protein